MHQARDYKKYLHCMPPELQIMKKWDRGNDSLYSCTVNTPKMPLKARGKKSWKGICKICTITYPQPSIAHWHTGQTLSHLCSVSAKRSCGSSQGCHLISEFMHELRLYADKQVHNPFGFRLKAGKKSFRIKRQISLWMEEQLERICNFVPLMPSTSDTCSALVSSFKNCQ